VRSCADPEQGVDKQSETTFIPPRAAWKGDSSASSTADATHSTDSTRGVKDRGASKGSRGAEHEVVTVSVWSRSSDNARRVTVVDGASTTSAETATPPTRIASDTKDKEGARVYPDSN